MNYTKGEWNILGKENYNEFLGYQITGDNQRCNVAIVPTHWDNSKANATLIAAAPKQNKALHDIDQWLIEHLDISDDPQLHIIHCHIQDALLAAEGEEVQNDNRSRETMCDMRDNWSQYSFSVYGSYFSNQTIL